MKSTKLKTEKLKLTENKIRKQRMKQKNPAGQIGKVLFLKNDRNQSSFSLSNVKQNKQCDQRMELLATISGSASSWLPKPSKKASSLWGKDTVLELTVRFCDQ